jgi:hypothetical protein
MLGSASWKELETVMAKPSSIRRATIRGTQVNRVRPTIID